MDLESSLLRTPKIIKIFSECYDIDLFQSQHLPEQRQVYSALLVEARRQMRIVEYQAKLAKNKAYLEILDAKKDLPEWKVRCLYEASVEFARTNDDLIQATYSVEVLETAIALISSQNPI